MSDSIKKDTIESPIDLADLGINSYAWSVQETINLLNWLDRHTKLIVLGGDLLLSNTHALDSEKVEFMNENWYYEPTQNDDDHQKSIQKAITYLEGFKSSPVYDRIIVDLVVS
jgi:hypothetical protein